MVPILLIVIVILSFFSIGLFLIVGSLKGLKFLVRPTGFHMRLFPYRWIRDIFGGKAIAYYHTFVGVVFILGAVWLLIYILFCV